MHLAVNDQIHLTEIRPSDKPAYLRHLNESDVFHRTLRLIPFPYTEADADAWLATATALTLERDRALPLAIRDQSGTLIGGCGLREIEPEHQAEIGYWLAVPFWGRGIATAVASTLCGYAFGELRLVRIWAHVFAGNAASARVLEKCGFELEGVLRKHVRKDGDFLDAMVYARLRPND